MPPPPAPDLLKPPCGPDVLILREQWIELAGLPRMRISGWLAPRSRYPETEGVLHWFVNGAHLSEERCEASLPDICGAIAIVANDKFFGSSLPISFDRAARAIGEGWLGEWMLTELRNRAAGAKPFLSACLDGPGLANLARRDVSWSELVYQWCPFPAMDAPKTLPELAVKKVVNAVSVWDPILVAYSGAVHPHEPLAHLSGDFRPRYVREAAEAASDAFGLQIRYHDYRDGLSGRARHGAGEEIEDLFLRSFFRHGLPRVEVSVTIEYTSPALVFRGSPRHRDNWLESSVLWLRADGEICRILRSAPADRLIEGRVPLAVLYDALQWSTGSLSGVLRSEFWPTKFDILRLCARGVSHPIIHDGPVLPQLEALINGTPIR